MKINITYKKPYIFALSQIPDFDVPDFAVFEKKMKVFEHAWKPMEKNILDRISKITGIRWTKRELICYMIPAGAGSWSEPLTVSLYEDEDKSIDALTHELIHINLSQEKLPPRLKNRILLFMKKYHGEGRIVANHIIIHAIHALILLDLFGEKRLLKEQNKVKDDQYKKSWQIAQEKGYRNITDSIFARD